MAVRHVPSRMRQLIAKKLGSNFREVTEIVDVPVPAPGPKEVLIRNRFLGINASDINYTAGRYDPSIKPPFPVGFEGLGEVVEAGSEAKYKVGQTVVYSKFGCFKDYVAVDGNAVLPVPACDPSYLTFMVSGLTAAISLEKLGNLSPGQVVLVTAAAGGTGQFAVQIAKRAGCHVIGTCSSDDKAEFLKTLGCDRAVNYKKENLDKLLSQEYPKGVDLVYESVGNEMLDTALKNLAVFGRIIVIGSISNYEASKSETFQQFVTSSKVDASMALLTKSASLQGFFLNHYRKESPLHLQQLTKLYLEGNLKVFTDLGNGVPTGHFVGLEKVVDAVEYMYSRRNIGKVVVQLPERSQL
ncbi:zinc-binding alcohol dehydrogenase domain-containing protein 2 [Biomphalaria pfeifferi]|uniref:15-oxoprostaglandin 13-reductase n=1 Tax=Biomphalaria pfeifferi TaxID=112525 RepID=A0AAD8B4X1_BIOPF|nr:zinc-binding alcohol dehydrogenase domain-containing protein 2 [Biomphalaria pfeifferi]